MWGRTCVCEIISGEIMSQIAIWRTLPVEPFGYWHHGVLCPDKTVIHFKSRASLTAKRNARIVHTSLDSFRGKSTPKETPIYRVKHRKQLSPDQVMRRARSCIGQRGYNLLHNNCESFARWCVVGDGRSYQIEKLTTALKDGYRNGNVPGAIHAVAKTAVDMPVPCPSMVPLSNSKSRSKSKRFKSSRDKTKSREKDRSKDKSIRERETERGHLKMNGRSSRSRMERDESMARSRKSVTVISPDANRHSHERASRSRPASPSRVSTREKTIRSRQTVDTTVWSMATLERRSSRHYTNEDRDVRKRSNAEKSLRMRAVTPDRTVRTVVTGRSSSPTCENCDCQMRKSRRGRHDE